MWLINIAFGSSTCALLFKTEEAAKAAWEIVSKPTTNVGPDAVDSYQLGRGSPFWKPILVSDDFGRHCFVNNILGATLEDMNAAQEGQIEVGLHQARGQVKAQQRGSADPIIQNAQRMHAQGPAILSPMGNGRGF